MFDALKKPDEEQNTAEPCENPEENSKEENQSEEVTTQELVGTIEADVLATLKALGGEERALLAEKAQLLNMEETLKQRIRDEVEIKMHRIENLKYEIPELKQRCEALAKALEIPVQK